MVHEILKSFSKLPFLKNSMNTISMFFISKMRYPLICKQNKMFQQSKFILFNTPISNINY